ncbi:hypothetical protein [Joostella sp. CR20]|uniref:hypothetical protein n=1 Tax=Joostella sp. CR20 TaxID=2804312 RepID=UPI00313E92C1
MNKKVITALTIVGTVFFTTTTFAQDRQRGERREPPKPEEIFKKLDADENGVVTKEEIKDDRMGARMLEQFDTIDTDESGDVTLEEFKTFFESRKKERRSRD